MRLNKLLPRFGEHTVLWCRANEYFVLKSFWQSHLHLSNDLPTDLLFFAAIALTKQVDLIRFDIIYNFSRLKMTACCVSLVRSFRGRLTFHVHMLDSCAHTYDAIALLSASLYLPQMVNFGTARLIHMNVNDTYSHFSADL